MLCLTHKISDRLIVFDTQGLNDLLEAEHPRFFYSFLRFSDVDYFDENARLEVAHQETLGWESAIRKLITRMVIERNNSKIIEELFDPMIALSIRHKHRGFSEESEVRIVAGAPNDQVTEVARKAGETRLRKPLHFVQRDGILVPHIALFERSSGEKAKLPIKRIVVGPHAEKLKRQKAIRLLLDQFEIDADVTTSDIPYLGH